MTASASLPQASWRGLWLPVWLLIPVALLNYLDRQMLATMRESMLRDIPGINTQEQWGQVLAAFKWTYALLSPFGGYIADRFSRRWVIGLSLLGWSAVTWATAGASSMNELLWTRAVMGLTEACYIPAALALIADHHPLVSRGRAIGLHQAGIYLGQILGGFAGYAADEPALGWRWAFSTCGMVGVVYALPLLALLRDAPHQDASAAAPNSSKASPAAAMRELFSNAQFLLLVACFTLPAIAGWVIRDWGPKILRDGFALSQGQAGATLVLSVQLASLVGALGGGLLADRWVQRNPRGRTRVSALGMLLFLPAMAGLGGAGHVGIAVAALIVFGLGWGLFDCNNMPILAQLTRPEVRATGYGLMNLVSISAGGLADWGYGLLRDRAVSNAAIFSGFAAIAALSALLMLRIRPPQGGQNHASPS